MRKKNIFIILILILITGISLRVYKLDSKELWTNEIISMCLAKDLSLTLDGRIDAHPPLYYVLLGPWIKTFGESEFVLRLFSLIWGVLSIIMIYKLGELFFDYRAGLISSLILAISPLHIWYSQEVRGYNLLTFLTIATTYFFIRALKENKNYLWAYFTGGSILSVYTGYYYFFIMLAGFIPFFLKRYRPLFRKWLLSCFIVGVFFLPFIPVLIRQILAIIRDFWMPKPPFLSLGYTLESFMLGYNATNISYRIITVLCLPLSILSIVNYKKQGGGVIMLFSFLFIPMLTAFLISQWNPIYTVRQLKLLSPFYYIIIGYGLTRVSSRMLKSSFVVMLSLLSMFSLINYYSNKMPLVGVDWRYHHPGVFDKSWVKFGSAAKYIEDNLKKGDIIAHSSYFTALPFLYYYHPRFNNNYYFIISSKWNEYYRKFNEGIEKILPVVYLDRGDIRRYEFKRVWLVFFDEYYHEEQSAVRSWMNNTYLKQNRKDFGMISVELYKPGH